MKIYFTKLIIVCFMCSFLSSLSAGFKWEEKNISIEAGAYDKAIDATFKFKNSGNKILEIIKLSSSCGCTTLTLDKKVYKPGEAGEIKVTMTLGINPGDIKKYIYVKAKDTSIGIQKLSLEAKRPKYLIFGERYIKWDYGEDLKPKFIDFKVEEGRQIKVTRIESSNETFSTELIVANGSYKIKVLPPNTKKPVRAIIKIFIDYPSDNPLSFTSTARVAIKPRP